MRLLGRPRRRCKNKVRVDLKDRGVNMRHRIFSTLEKGYWEKRPCKCGSKLAGSIIHGV